MFYTYNFFIISQGRVNFSAKQTEVALEFLRNHPELYDLTNRLYSDKVHKTKLKKELAELLQVQPWKIDTWYALYRRELTQASRKSPRRRLKVMLRAVESLMTPDLL